MAGSTSNLDLVTVAQSNKETTINALFDAGSPATTFGRRASTSGALTWGYYGGVMLIAGTPTLINNGTLALTANTTNYIEVNPTGTVSTNTVGFTGGNTPLYQVVVGPSSVTSWLDKRAFLYTVNNQPFDLATYLPGKPASLATMSLVTIARTVIFPAGLTNSYGKAIAATTLQKDFDIQKNGSSVGTMRFAAGASTATFIMATNTSFAAGDILKVVAPAVADATLSDVYFTLAGTR